MFTPAELVGKADEYSRRRGINRAGRLGQGKDGAVWHTSRPSALKIHEREASYQSELDAYIRFRDVKLTDIAGLTVPALIDHDEKLLAIEMQIVFPPFIVDFASARLDEDPELIEDEGNTLEDLVRERFGARADEVMSIYNQLIGRAGVYLSDLHPHNIKFGNGA